MGSLENKPAPLGGAPGAPRLLVEAYTGLEADMARAGKDERTQRPAALGFSPQPQTWLPQGMCMPHGRSCWIAAHIRTVRVPAAVVEKGQLCVNSPGLYFTMGPKPLRDIRCRSARKQRMSPLLRQPCHRNQTPCPLDTPVESHMQRHLQHRGARWRQGWRTWSSPCCIR